MRLSDGELRGRVVIAADGRVVGEITGLILDSEAWAVGSVQVELRKETADAIGASRTLFRRGSLEIPVQMIQSVGATIVLSVPSNELRDVLPSQTESAPTH